MTIYQLIQILQEYARTYGDDHYVVATTEEEVFGDVVGVGRTNKGETAIVFEIN